VRKSAVASEFVYRFVHRDSRCSDVGVIGFAFFDHTEERFAIVGEANFSMPPGRYGS
jgi:hypothetical protein